MKRALNAILGATRLDNVITNAHTAYAVGRFEAVPIYERSHIGIRNRPHGGIAITPLSAWSRSWYSPNGRINWKKELFRRCYTLGIAAEWSTELPKLITLTYADIAESWTGAHAIRDFMNALRTHLNRRGHGVNYFWSAETQDRFALHFHIVLTGCPYVPKKLLERWWKPGFVDIEAIPIATATKYVVSYIKKGVGRDAPGDLLRHLMHSLFRARRFGCSRAIGAKMKLIPAWLSEWCALHGAEPNYVDWETSPDSSDIFIFYDGEFAHRMRERTVTWRILTELSSSPRRPDT